MKEMGASLAALMLCLAFSARTAVLASSPHSQTLHELGQARLDAHTDPAAINVYGNRNARECRTW
jgi:hypothetical protein